MRPFELLLLLPLIPFILWPLFAPIRPRWLLTVTAVFPLLIHLAIEQFRWQMVPAYGLTMSVITSADYLLLKGKPVAIGKRWLSILLSLLGIIWAAFAILSANQPFPSPSCPPRLGHTKSGQFQPI